MARCLEACLTVRQAKVWWLTAKSRESAVGRACELPTRVLLGGALAGVFVVSRSVWWGRLEALNKQQADRKLRVTVKNGQD